MILGVLKKDSDASELSMFYILIYLQTILKPELTRMLET